MATMNDALDRLVVLLQTNAGLTSYATTKWGKAFTIKRRFRQRPQINSSELPLIMITRPGVTHGDRLNGGSDNTNRVHLYIGFHQNDTDKAQSEIVEVEEMIDDILDANYRLKDIGGNPLVKNVRPGDSVNDEGMMHPDYFMVKEVEIEHYR